MNLEKMLGMEQTVCFSDDMEINDKDLNVNDYFNEYETRLEMEAEQKDYKVNLKAMQLLNKVFNK